jgi:cytochrome c-type biogenesis protein CcmE
MDPSRKRTIRLVVALGAAVLLAAALVYTSFSASSEARTPSELDTARAGVTYQLTGKVVDGSVERTEQGVDFEVRDRDGAEAVPISYQGVVPDPFRGGAR